MKTTRRTFLGGAAVASLPIAAAASVAVATPEETPQQRLDRLVSEFKATVTEINPNVRFSEDSVHLNLDDESASLPLMIVAQWATGRYEGDGTYRGSKYDRYSRYKVVKLDHHIEGQRAFSVIAVGERDRKKWMTLSEPRLESFIGERLR